MMLMADMSESERQTTREMNVHWLPEGAELIEVVDILWCGWECDHAMALVRMPDGEVRLKVLGGTAHPDNDDPVSMLEKRIAAYEEAAGETRRFLEIAKAALALGIMDRAPDVPPDPGDGMPDGERQQDRLMREIYDEMREIGSLGDGDEEERDDG